MHPVVSKAAGCSGERLRQQPVKRSKIPNLICTLPGQSDQLIVVGAHLDFAGEGSKGVIDNWSGASSMTGYYDPYRLIATYLAYLDQVLAREREQEADNGKN